MVRIVAASLLFLFIISTAADESYDITVQVQCDGAMPLLMVIQTRRAVKGIVTLEELFNFCANKEGETKQEPPKYKWLIRWPPKERPEIYRW